MASKESNDLRSRLRQLGSRRRRKPTPPRAPSAPWKQPVNLPEGETVSTPHGEAFRIVNRYPLQFEHGVSRLGDLLEFDGDGQLTAQVARHEALTEAPLATLSYLDTETTGLVGGAGTLIFLVGLGRFLEDSFVLHQYLLREPGEEESMLHALRQDIEASGGFVTFNGRSFDVPLLEMRYVIGLRQRWRLTGWPHLDLLHPARRLWRRELPDCRLSTLEREVLQIQRAEQDVPGEEIPGLYLDYLRTGDAGQLSRVVYHNEVDILSLVGLAREVIARHQDPDLVRLSGAEALAVGRWHEGAGRQGSALAAYEAASARRVETGVRREAMARLGVQLKRQERYQEAVELWLEMCELAPDDPEPRIELAKHYEWRAKEPEKALTWAEQALVSLERRPAGWRRQRVRGEIEHRIDRLRGKVEGGSY